MNIWNGIICDTANRRSDEFLKINSCGFQTHTTDTMILREKGRVDYHILVLNSGKCTAFFGDTVTEMKPGDCFVYSPDTPQKYIFDRYSTSLWIHFSGTAVNNLLSKADITDGVIHLPPSSRITDSFTELIRRHHTSGSEDYAIASLIELIYNIRDAKNETATSHSSVISSILTYLCTNYNTNVSLESLAKMSGYSKSRFSHLFAEETGTTPVKYQNDIRLKVSAQMLTSTSLAVSEIAGLCGFDDPLYYSRLFGRKYGTSPTRYRKDKS
jgi:AraC-like DNA-binding protein